MNSDAEISRGLPAAQEPARLLLDYSELAVDSARRLTKMPLPNEDTVRDELGTLIRELGFHREFESSVSGGSVDIFLPNCNFVIETKDQDEVGPERIGSRTDETQLDQLQRYVLGKSAEYRDTLPLKPQKPTEERWKGLLTDGRTYFLYSWIVSSDGNLIETSQETRSFVLAAPEQLCMWLENRIDERASKLELPSTPDAVADIFRRFAPQLKELYTKLSKNPGTTTKHSLWLEMNRGSGFAVDDSETDLFVDHTLLIHAAEAVISTLEGSEKPGTKVIDDGFASWPQDRDRLNNPRSTEGAKWTDMLFDTVCDYDWRGRGRDVLRDVYESVIKREHRKAFGEYYTPDWLAEVVVAEVLDDEWCERAVSAALESGDAPLEGVGVLDPACGSGTFLYHATRRILNSDALKRQHLSPQRRARVVARLVNGIDIHPIAVSIARATLMRAMPENAGIGHDELNVFQGDSLAVRQLKGIKIVNDNPSAPYMEILSPNGIAIPVPVAFAETSDFNSRLRRIVRSAHVRDPLPSGIANDLPETDQSTVRQMHDALTQVCNEEGNNVWVWYLSNQMATYMLTRRGVDRIVANPPWVVMSDIQVPKRKAEMEALIEELEINPSGKNAAAFDIAGAFVKRCRELYLKADGAAAGWVLNWSALSGSNWQKVRDDQHPFNRLFLDFSKVRDKPFHGANSCAWIQTETTSAIETRIFQNSATDKVRSTDSATEFERKTTWVAADRRLPIEPSDYLTDGIHSFRSGARLAPHCLVLLKEVNDGPKPGVASVTMQKSRHGVWKDVTIQIGEVPAHYVHDAVLCSQDLLTFALSARRTGALLPLDTTGNPDFIDDTNLECRDLFWRGLDDIYRERRGKGGSTPKTLWERLTYQGGLMEQLRTSATKGDALVKVAYNSSGQILRAARATANVLMDDGCYYYIADTADEAAYLTALLNSPCLQVAFQQARRSDRDFHLHIWEDVPIPRYDNNNADHVMLAALCKEAEAAASGVVRHLSARTGQIKASSEIRRELMTSGIANRIDEVARRIMPKHSLSKYDEARPHPWNTRKTKRTR